MALWRSIVNPQAGLGKSLDQNDPARKILGQNGPARRENGQVLPEHRPVWYENGPARPETNSVENGPAGENFSTKRPGRKKFRPEKHSQGFTTLLERVE